MTYSAISSHEEQDPYPNYEIEIQNETKRLMSDFEHWKDMLHNTNTAQNADFQALTETLKKRYKSLNRSLKELKKSIFNIEQNHEQFSNICDSELHVRKVFLKEMQEHISKCRNGMKASKAIIEQHKKETYASSMDANGISHSMHTSRVINNEFIADQREQMQIERKDQDEVMEDMLITLERLGAHGTQINIQLDSHKDMLHGVNDEMDGVQQKMNRLTKKLDQLLGHSEGKKIGLIVFLIIVIAIMIYFII